MAQHFLLSAKARTLSLVKVMHMSDEEALETFKAIRWADNDGEAYCPKCGCTAVYGYKSRPIFKSKGCKAQFSVTSGTIFASRKLARRDILAAIAIFVNGAKGISALQLSRDLDVQYKTAFVMAHKLREAMGAKVAHATPAFRRGWVCKRRQKSMAGARVNPEPRETICFCRSALRAKP